MDLSRCPQQPLQSPQPRGRSRDRGRRLRNREGASGEAWGGHGAEGRLRGDWKGQSDVLRHGMSDKEHWLGLGGLHARETWSIPSKNASIRQPNDRLVPGHCGRPELATIPLLHGGEETIEEEWPGDVE